MRTSSAMAMTHITIQKRRALPVLEQCSSCCHQYHCPFCDISLFKPTKHFKVKLHLESHFNRAVFHEDLTIHRCGLQCRTPLCQLHYHCVYCQKTVIRRCDFHRHIELCKARSRAAPSAVEQTNSITTTTAPVIALVASVEQTTTPVIALVASVEQTTTSSVTAPAASITFSQTPSPSPRIRRAVTRKRCPICNTLMNKCNLNKHMKRKHSKHNPKDINWTCHLKSELLDEENGIYAVIKNFRGQSIPLHVQLKTWGDDHCISCESLDCLVAMDMARRSGLPGYQCHHVRSVMYSTSSAKTVSLSEDVLSEMVESKWFGEDEKNECLSRQHLAEINNVALSVFTAIAVSHTKKCVSVYEPTLSHYSRLGRVMVVYDTKLNQWYCPCAKLPRSCLHKCIAKWHLFQFQRYLFGLGCSAEVDVEPNTDREWATCSGNKNVNGEESGSPTYPPEGVALENMVRYILQCKKIPAVLPDNMRLPSLEKEYPRYLIPEETVCQRCPGIVLLSDPFLITTKGKILTNCRIVEDISTYCKHCPECGMLYRYQEWKEGLHNYNDKIILDLPLCLTLRNLLQVHTAVSRAVEYLELTTGVKFPPSGTVLHGYLHFEALTAHEYKYSCVTCGDNPPVVVMDLHKNGVFHSLNDIEEPPTNFNGEVDVESFWEALSMEMVGRGFVTSSRNNPFAVTPSYHFWAPWIGPTTRHSKVVLNTEFKKVHQPKTKKEVAESEKDGLTDELFKQKVPILRKLCRECGLDSKGSRSNLLVRLSNGMKSRETYDKIYEKMAASGGWAVIMCPCGIVYSLKYNLRAESPSDFTDMLLSWTHMPNVVLYDFAQSLATHTNLRVPEAMPFSPHEGSLMAPTAENIKLAQGGKLRVSLPWLESMEEKANADGHPITGSSDHYALYDKFHEDDVKDGSYALREIGLVPQLAGKLNRQVAEQLFSKMKKNNYFLNMSLPSAHLFQMRNLIHHHNESKNNSILKRLRDSFCVI